MNEAVNPAGGADGLPNATNASSFGAFEAGASPFKANTVEGVVPLNEVAETAGVVRSGPGKVGATGGINAAVGEAALPLEEGVAAGSLARGARSGNANTGAGNASLSELEAEGATHLSPASTKVRTNTVLPELNEVTVPRR